MKKFLTLCDFYGEHFHWYIGFKPKYYTYIGGIFSILSFLSFIIIFVALGYHDFKKKYPISSTSTIPQTGNRNLKFGEEKLYLPWRIIDYDQNSINITGIIYPRIYYFTVQQDNITGKLITKSSLINYKLCNETSMKYLGKEYIIDIPIEALYCIDMEDLKIGGSLNNNFLNFIRFDLYMCEDAIDYNESNNKCTTYENLQDIYGGGDSLFFELLYPVVQFQPLNLNVPTLILYKTHYYIINKYSNKLDRLYLQEHIFEDDQNLFFNNPKNISYWGVNAINGESYFHGKKDVLRYASTSKLYTLNIYFDLGIIYYTRKYKKLYEILGGMFPIISLVWTIFEIFSKIFNEIKMAKKLNEHIINFDSNERRNESKRNKKSLKILKFNNITDKNITNINNMIDKNNINNKEKNHNNKISKTMNIVKNKNFSIKEEHSNKLFPIINTLDDSSKLFCNQSNININPKNQRKTFRRSNTVIIYTKEENSDLFKKKENFPLNYYFFGFLYNKADIRINKGSKLYCLSENFNKYFSFFRHFIDITSYLSMYKDYEQFKKVVCNKLSINEQDNYQTDIKNFEKNNKLFKKDNINHLKKRLSMKNLSIKLN